MRRGLVDAIVDGDSLSQASRDHQYQLAGQLPGTTPEGVHTCEENHIPGDEVLSRSLPAQPSGWAMVGLVLTPGRTGPVTGSMNDAEQRLSPSRVSDEDQYGGATVSPIAVPSEPSTRARARPAKSSGTRAARCSMVRSRAGARPGWEPTSRPTRRAAPRAQSEGHEDWRACVRDRLVR